MKTTFSVPIALFIFNRPDTTSQVFACIKALKPQQLFVIADGPRKDKEGKLCEQTRKITEDINWDCKIKRLYSETNLGCKKRVSSGLDWFFGQVEQGIVLEDDCIASPSFFTFCEKLLNTYRNYDNIMHISGNNFLPVHDPIDSYYFSKIPHVWGWASWKRAWKKYNVHMSDYPSFNKANKLNFIFPKNIWARKTWQYLFNRTYHNTINTWDYQWTYAIFKNKGICINPSVNLVANIGFDTNATHTSVKNSFSKLPTNEINTITHPDKVEINEAADNYILAHNFQATLPGYVGLRARKLWSKFWYKLIKTKLKYL